MPYLVILKLFHLVFNMLHSAPLSSAQDGVNFQPTPRYLFVLVSLLHTTGSVSWGTVEASSRKLTPHLSYLFGGELTLCERKVDIACCCEARIQNRVDKRTFVISPTSTTINSSTLLSPLLTFCVHVSNSSRWNLCHAEAGCSLMHLFVGAIMAMEW